MSFWSVRESLSNENRLRRSYYELLRDELDELVITYSLIDSYHNFINQKIPYPFVERRELKPRARIPSIEYDLHNSFLIIFVEDVVPDVYKKFIRFFDDNKTTKTNLLKIDSLPLSQDFDRNHKYLESAHFNNFIRTLLPIDYALLIQRDPSIKAKNRYALSHFHVKIDWPIAEAAESMAQELRYISKDLYEKGDKYAEDTQKKFFEYYGLPMMAGGRRTAAVVAAQYFRRLPCITTVYAGSSESRALIRISERGVSKAILVMFTKKEVMQIAADNNMAVDEFISNYEVAREEANGIYVLQVIYAYTVNARPPLDGKLREINPDLYWLTVGAQQIVPKPGVWSQGPIQINLIYS